MRKPSRVVTILLPMDVYEEVKELAGKKQWPLSRYLRQMIRRYLCCLEENTEEVQWWRI